MATHSSVLAWGIPGMGEPGGLPSTWSHRVGHDYSDLAAAVDLIIIFLVICLFFLTALKIFFCCFVWNFSVSL